MCITQLQVSLNKSEEDGLTNRKFKKVRVDLNKGAGGASIHLWYREGKCAPITRIQFSFNDEMSKGLSSAGYHKVDKNLNAGAGGDPIYLWYYRGNSPYDVPIEKVIVSARDEAQKFAFGWERLACDLNRNAGGEQLFMWLRREKKVYVCDITTTDSYEEDEDLFRNGFIRVDENTNRSAGGVTSFIWYRHTTDPKGALTELQVSTKEDEYYNFEDRDYQPVVPGLNEGTGGNQVIVWYKKDECQSPIQTITVLFSEKLVPDFESKGVQVIDKNLNSGDGCAYSPATPMFLCFYK